MASSSSLFGATSFAPQSALEILRTTKQLPIARATNGADLGVLAWGIGSANWRANRDTSPAWITMKKELRTLVAASFDSFMRLQRLHDEKARTDRALVPEEIVRASREYREALKTAIFALEDRADGDASDEDDELLDLLKVSLAIWHLCELLFLQRRPREDKALAYELALWVQEHYGSAKMELLDGETTRLRSLGASANAEKDTAFWSTIYALVAMGCGAQAWSVLSLHSSFRALFAHDASGASAANSRESFQSIQRLLLCMPGGNSQQQIDWQNWRDACQYLLTTDAFIRERHEFVKLLEIMTANPSALQSVSTSWYELMMARLFLEEPKAIAHRFEFLMANCFQTFHVNNTKETMNNFDCIVLALLEYDVQSAMQDIYALGFHWMAAHLTDLLVKSTVIAGDQVVDQYGCSLEEYFVLQYAMDLSVCKSTWQFTTKYFEKCRVFGLTARRSVVTSEPIQSDAKADCLMSYCRGAKGMQHTQRQVALRRAYECKAAEAFASALQWALRGIHEDETDVIAELVLDSCKLSGSLTPLFEAVEFLESQQELARTSKLQWLVAYRELNLVLEDHVALKLQLTAVGTDDHEQIKTQLHFVAKQAASRLQDLMAASIAPRRLRATLLGHAELLLRETPAVMSSEQLFAVMEYVQSIERAFDHHDFEKNPVNVKLKNRVQTLLARNLSTAILAEGGRGGFPKHHHHHTGSSSTQQASSSSRSFASLTANHQLLAESHHTNGTTAHGLVDFMGDESMD